MRKKAVIPPKLSHWFANETNVTRLRELLDEPILQQAFAMLRDAAGPDYTTLVNDVESNARRHCWLAGYRDFQNDLEKLTKMPASTNPPTQEEWTHIQ